MKTTTLTLIATLLLAGAAAAQEPPPPDVAPAPEEAPAEFDPVPEPPDLPSRLEDGQPIEPQVTIVRKGDAVIEEYRANGRMFMVKVTPKVGPSYYLLDRDGDGRMESRMSKIHEEFAVPQWVIFSW